MCVCVCVRVHSTGTAGLECVCLPWLVCMCGSECWGQKEDGCLCLGTTGSVPVPLGFSASVLFALPACAKGHISVQAYATLHACVSMWHP